MSLANNAAVGKLWEIGEKLVHNGRYMIPAVGLFFLVRDLWIYFWQIIGDFLQGLVSGLIAKITAQMENIGVDLTPPPEFMGFVGKANSVVPLEEAWRYLLIYLAFASVVMGIKWTRNLMPGMS